MKPRVMIENVEREARLPAGADDRFSGYGVMGVTFSSGHILALRRFPASSIGPGYWSVWHHVPTAGWTFYSTVSADVGCGRYFGAEIRRNLVVPIAITWLSDDRFRVQVGTEIEWDISLRDSLTTGALNAMARVVPDRLWQAPGFVRLMGAVAGLALGTGTINLIGRTPNGHRYSVSPHRLWLIDSSRAVVRGVDLGAMRPLHRQAFLGDFAIPQRGVFAVAQARFERPAASTRSAARWSAPGNPCAKEAQP